MSEGTPASPGGVVYDVILKVIVIGDSSVGKSSLLQRYCEDDFQESYAATIGIDFKLKGAVIDNKNVGIQFWDTAGQERFRAITFSYYRGVDGILLVYDMTNRESFRHVKDWLQYIRNYSGDDVFISLIGSKKDLELKRQVTAEEGKALAQEYELHSFFEVSSKSGEGVAKSVEETVNLLLHRKITKFAANGDNAEDGATPKNENYAKLLDEKSAKKQKACC